MTRDEAEAAVPRVKAALAEAGWPAAAVRVIEEDGEWGLAGDHSPPQAWWTALLVTGCSVNCWGCWQLYNPDCDHDHWTSERPRLERAS